MTWPNALIKELAHRRCMIFLGSGASASSTSAVIGLHPPKWLNYLEGLIAKMNDNRDELTIRDLLSKEKYLDAAEIIKANISPADYTEHIRQTLLIPKFNPSIIHEAVLKIDPKIVVTTNYDNIYDHYCNAGAGTSSNGYNICKYYEGHLVNDLRSPIRSIIKAHGCITDPSKTILTRSDFFNAKSNYPNFYKVMDSLFITNTILFVGYSLSDPDFQLVLENSSIASNSQHPHYACVPNDIHLAIKTAMRKSYNIEFIEFTAGNYSELETGLTDLANDVESYRTSNPI